MRLLTFLGVLPLVSLVTGRPYFIGRDQKFSDLDIVVGYPVSVPETLSLMEQTTSTVSAPETLSLLEKSTVSAPETLSLLELTTVSSPQTLSRMEITTVSTPETLNLVEIITTRDGNILSPVDVRAVLTIPVLMTVDESETLTALPARSRGTETASVTSVTSTHVAKSVSTASDTRPSSTARVGPFQPQLLLTTTPYREAIPRTPSPTYTGVSPYSLWNGKVLPISLPFVSARATTSSVRVEPTSPSPASTLLHSTSWAESVRPLTVSQFTITLDQHKRTRSTTTCSSDSSRPTAVCSRSPATTGMASVELGSYNTRIISSPQITNPPVTTILVQLTPSTLIRQRCSTAISEPGPLFLEWTPDFGVTDLGLKTDPIMLELRAPSYVSEHYYTAQIPDESEASCTTGRDLGIGPSPFSASYPTIEPHWSDSYFREPITLSSHQVTSVTLFPCPHDPSSDRLCIGPPTSRTSATPKTELHVRTPSPAGVSLALPTSTGEPMSSTTFLHIDLSLPENGGHMMGIREPMESTERHSTLPPSPTMPWDSDWFEVLSHTTVTHTPTTDHHNAIPTASTAVQPMNDTITSLSSWYNGPVATLTTITTRRQEIWASTWIAPILVKTQTSSSSMSRYTRRRIPPQPRSTRSTTINGYTSFLVDHQASTETELPSALIKFRTITLPLFDGRHSTLTVCEPSATRDPYENLTHIEMTPEDIEYFMARQLPKPVNTDPRTGYGELILPAASVLASRPLSLPPIGNINVNNIRLNTATSIVCSESTWAVLIVFMVLFPITFTIVMTELLIRHIWFRGVPGDIKIRLLADKRYRGYERMIGVGIIATVSVLIGVLVACYLRNGMCEDIKVYEDLAGVGQREF
ncbi:hypothetical protein TWF569_009540 [Orbilia oligospora]|uniref:Uncharacterized protein n=1 Tax=Orbilia oligospora TaxID=2813651 RepID=A0A7C8JQL8_ORBOL|nr:hypothetical protein TWF703_007353 [Orbilia oligospora]KAF3136232.1 hypothetical protein TWF569_009540 [Orbilia oligospora]